MKVLLSATAILLTFLAALGWCAEGDKSEKAADAKKPPYNEKADAKAQVEAALASAKRENRRVLIQWGANWCPWCRALHQSFATDYDLAKTLRSEYDVVLIDVGEGFFAKNTDLAVKYGADANIKKFGVPVLTVLDGDGKVLINQKSDPFEKTDTEKKSHDPEKLLEFLKANQAAPRKADEVLSAATAEAAKSGRNVLLRFGNSECGACLRLDAWLETPAAAAVLNKDFVLVKIDLARMEGATEVFKRYNPGDQIGVPWFAALDGKGKIIVTSDGPKGNIGFPEGETGIAHFVKMLEKSKQRITDKEVEELRKSLAEQAKE